MQCNRQFNWISSAKKDDETLLRLNQSMIAFYGQKQNRESYQKMLETQEEELPIAGIRHLMPKYLCSLQPKNILEIGCGNGRIYRQLRSYGYTGAYSGIEVADYIIEQNQQRHSEAVWQCASAYKLPFSDNLFDVCFSLYVLEHFVYPEEALNEMLRVLKPKGSLILVFPDFVESGRLPSQQLGFSPGRASEKLRCGRLIDALVSLYDSRIRLPKKLKDSISGLGPFPINTRPLCLSYPLFIEADVDAIYIASKREIYHWALAKGHLAEFPYGTAGELSEQAFIVITK